MKNNVKKLYPIVWLLCIVMLLQAFTACRAEPDKNENTQPQTTDMWVLR